MRGRFRLFDLIRSRADRTSLARSQSTTAHSWRRPNRFPKLSGQHPRPDHAQRARLSGRWRRPQVKDIFPQAVEVELPGDDTPACGGAPKRRAAVAELSPLPRLCPYLLRRRRRRQSEGAAHDDRSASRWTKISPLAPSPPPPPNRHGRRLSGALIGFDRTQQSLAPEQCLRRATLRLAHGLEQGACHLSAAVWAGSTTGSWPNFSPPTEFRKVFPATLKRFPDQRSRIPCYSPQGISP